jgi:hypothetical protein
MTTTAVQIHCPYCNALQAPQASGSYSCEFCLQPFSVQDAQREEARLLEEIRAWVEQKVGAAGSGAGVDAASRGYIFQQRVLPDLRRDVDRALERIGSYGQFPLLVVPVRVASPNSHQPNPLVSARRDILGLKGLRARLSSDEVTSFAARDVDRFAIRSMDRQLASLVHLSNVAEAAAGRTPEGYAAARRNLETLAEEVGHSITTEGAQDPALGAFLGGLYRRFQALGEICRVCEEAGSPNVISGTALADRADGCAVALTQTAQQVEGSNYAPADAMPVVVAVHQEAAAARALARWLRSYEIIAGRAQVSFPVFVMEMDAITGGPNVPPDGQAEILEAVGYALSALRGAAAVPVLGDFAWVAGWSESSRQRKSLGMFGVEEKLAGVEQFLSPFWVADVTFSRAQGAVFTSGQEQRAIVLLDACAPQAQRVVVVGAEHGALAHALANQGVVAGLPAAMPRSNPTQAAAVMMQGLRGKPEYLNPRLRIRGMAFLPVATATFSSTQGTRVASACLGGSVPVDDYARAQVQTTQQLLNRYG